MTFQFLLHVHSISQQKWVRNSFLHTPAAETAEGGGRGGVGVGGRRSLPKICATASASEPQECHWRKKKKTEENRERVKLETGSNYEGKKETTFLFFVFLLPWWSF